MFESISSVCLILCWIIACSESVTEWAGLDGTSKGGSKERREEGRKKGRGEDTRNSEGREGSEGGRQNSRRKELPESWDTAFHCQLLLEEPRESRAWSSSARVCQNVCGAFCTETTTEEALLLSVNFVKWWGGQAERGERKASKG